MLKVKTCFDFKMFDVGNWVACLNGENGPGGMPSHEVLSVSPQGALEISSVVGQPHSLDRDHFSTPRVLAESRKCDEGCRPSQGDAKSQAVQLPHHCNCSRLARDALILGPSAALNRDPTSATSVNNTSQAVPQLCVSQQSTTSQPPRLVSRSGHLQEQGFSVEVALLPLKGHQQGPSTGQSGLLFEKWGRENSVDFSIPSVKQVSDFFMYQDQNRRPSTIDGYRTAIVDTLGPAGLHISQRSDLNRLLSSFQRDHPQRSRNLPKWNLSVVLNELTKAPFEPMKDTDLKHLTLKTAFLLVLDSSNCRSKIRAWVETKYLM